MNFAELWRKSIKEADLSRPGRKLLEDEYFCEKDGLIYCRRCNMPRECAMDFGGFGVMQRLPVRCRCEKERKEREEEAYRQAERLLKTRRRRSRGMADSAYHKCRFENDKGYNPRVLAMAKKYVESWEELKRKNEGLLLWGDTGTGKTFTAACIANALIDSGVSVIMTSFPRLSEELTGKHFNSRSEFIDSLNEFDLLVIDDLGVERGTDFNLEQIYRIVDGRYRSDKPMIVTTNLKPDDMIAEAGVEYKRIYDRILEMCAPLRMNDMNIRRRKASQKTRDLKRTLEQPPED